MADKDTKTSSGQRFDKKDKLKKKPSRRHTEQRQAEQEQDKGFADQVPQEDTSTVPNPFGFSIFYKKESVIRQQVEFPTFAKALKKPGEFEYAPDASSKTPETESLAQALERLLKDHTPACVIVNQNHEIVYVQGRTAKYLEPAKGKLSVKVTGMAREGLRFPLPSGLRGAGENKDQPIRQHGLSVETNGNYQSLDLTVKYIHQTALKDCIMILFEDRFDMERRCPERNDAGTDGGRIAELETELMRVNQDYRGVLEELEASNEELKPLSEEMHSSNEELQSTNEELESSREELQSLKEDLSTVNAQLQNKIGELKESYSAITRVLNSTRIAIALSMHGAEEQALKMQSAGAVAYLSKTCSPDEILSAIR
ncbi:MAG: hypothetical protein PVI27_07075 [Desulfobacteraceae bacterium]|jgi:hypothetical protein